MNAEDIRALLDVVPVNVYAKRADGVFLYCNKPQAKVFGLDNTSILIGKKESDVFHGQLSLGNCRKNDHQVIDSGVPSLFEETLLVDNKKMTMISSKSPIKDSSSGAIIGIFGVSIDISSKESQFNFLKEERDNAKITLENIISNLPGHVYWLDNDKKIAGCNLQQVISMGFDDPNSLIGKTVFDVLSADEASKIDKINEGVIKSGEAHYAEEIITLKNGSVSTFASKKVPLYDENNHIKGVLGISLDITELKETQEKMQEALGFAEEAERRRKQFLTNQEHDINTALAGIVYSGNFLGDFFRAKADEDHLEMADMIAKCGQLLQAYNRSLLRDLCWLDNEGQLIERRANIRVVVDKIYKINFLAAKANGTKLLLPEVDDDIPQYLMVDDIALFQCLQDLVGNAVSFTKDGQVALRVKLSESIEKDKPVIAFHVKDNGRGIKDAHQRYIFEDFYKVLPSNVPDLEMGIQADEDKGRGLGLAISRKKAEAMGGELHLEWSCEGEGSEFVLTLPLKAALNQSSQ